MVADELPDLTVTTFFNSTTQFPQEFTPQTLWPQLGESQRAAQRLLRSMGRGLRFLGVRVSPPLDQVLLIISDTFQQCRHSLHSFPRLFTIDHTFDK